MSSGTSGQARHLRSDASIDVQLRLTTLDIWLARNSILQALRAEVSNMSGLVLDVGCGVQPYRSVLLGQGSRVEYLVGVDIQTDRYGGHDVAWDGYSLPFRDAMADQVIATEVLEHCPSPQVVLDEAFRVLRPGGRFFFTVPFLWPLHDMPHDEYRYTPFALGRLLGAAGFRDIDIRPLGGWDASLAQMLGLWVRRRPLGRRRRVLLSAASLPLVWGLARKDRPPDSYDRSVMLTGLSGTAVRPLDAVEP